MRYTVYVISGISLYVQSVACWVMGNFWVNTELGPNTSIIIIIIKALFASKAFSVASIDSPFYGITPMKYFLILLAISPE